MRTLITILAMGLAATTAAFGQTVRPHPTAQFMPLRVFDATDKLIAGTAGDSDPAEALAVTFLYQATPTSKGDAFTLGIKAPPSDGPLGFYWASLPNDTFYFESADCTGQPYVQSPGSMPGRRLAVLDIATNLLYLSEPKPTIVAKTYHSRRPPLDSCDDNLGGESILLAPVDPVIDMDNVFALPFEIR